MNQQPSWLNNDRQFLQPIVGEHAYQEALEEITDCEIDQGESIDFPASLLLENNNPHDSNAVQVQIIGQTVGYLSRPDAKVFRHKLAALNNAGATFETQARITATTDDGDYRVKLDIQLSNVPPVSKTTPPPLAPPLPISPPKPDIISQTATGIKTFFKSMIIITLCVLILIAVFENFGKDSQAEAEQTRRAALTPEQRTAEDQATAKAAAEKKIAEDLFNEKATALFACDELIKAASKDPSSVEYLYDATQAPITKRPDGRFDVQQRIRAKNSFGALTLNTVDCRISNSNGEWKGRIVRTF